MNTLKTLGEDYFKKHPLQTPDEIKHRYFGAAEEFIKTRDHKKAIKKYKKIAHDHMKVGKFLHTL